MTQPAKANEPSMEEILASIRRIIADDDVSKSAQAAPEAAPPAAPVAPAARPAVLPPRLPAAPQRVSSPEASQLEAASAAAATDDGVVDEQSADILELTESMATPTPAAPAPQFRTIEGNLDVGFDEQPEKAAPQPAAEAQPQLISRATGAAVDSAFNTLAQTVLVHNARTLEDLVREMLRPLLKAWLDENLPGVVERLVRAEIERVSRGR
jgi:cell pole-organizing protein PopZ